MGAKELQNSLFNKSQKLLKEIEQKKDIFIFTNSTVDGIISGSIILKSIFNNLGNAMIRCSFGKIENNIDEIIKEKHDFYIFTDFNSNIIDIINKIFNEDNSLFINTDEITKSNNDIVYENILNPWIYNINGQKEITCAGLAYFLVKNFDRNSNRLSFLPVISAISKEQDIGENKSLTSFNNEILQTSLKLNLIEQKKRLDISEKETVPITNILENNINHYIKEITWNNETSLKIIKDSNLLSDTDGSPKLFNELDEKDFASIYESIVKFLQNNSKLNNIQIIKDLLLGYNYILINEEDEGFMKNARSFVKVLSLCLISQKIGLALSLCLGERGEILKDVCDLVIKYNSVIKKTSSQLFGEKWRFYDDKETIFINGEGILDVTNVSPFVSFLESSVSFADRLICLRILESEEYYKFIITKTKFCKYDLISIKEKIIKMINKDEDIKINDKNKLEIKISVSNLEGFLSNIKKIIINEKTS
jgi:single-stranded-DNA-specific exonuclease